jgi:iron complex outermembrane receptor protein
MHDFAKDALRSLLMLAVGIGLLGCASSQPPPPQSDKKTDENTVHVGYGEKKEENVLSATSTVTPDEQDRDTATNFSDLIDGRMAGVRVRETSSGIRVIVRGVNSINSGTAPLYVVDGLPVEPNYNGAVPVLPRDIESISVLKGASATSMYGARGANGVVVIKTKVQ